MNPNSVPSKLFRLFACAAIGTFMSLALTRRFDTWYVGLLGVVFAIALCDPKKTVEAFWEVFGNTIKGVIWAVFSLMVLTIGIMPMHIGVTYFVSPWTAHFATPITLVLGFIAAMLAVCMCLDKGSFKFPLCKMIGRMLPDDSGPGDKPERKITLRDREGKLVTAHGVREALVMARDWTLIIIALNVCVLLWIVIILDALITLFFYVATTQSVAAGVGALIAFSADYLLRPSMATKAEDAAWMIGASLFGGLLGVVLWKVRQRLEYPCCSKKLAAA